MTFSLRSEWKEKEDGGSGVSYRHHLEEKACASRHRWWDHRERQSSSTRVAAKTADASLSLPRAIVSLTARRCNWMRWQCCNAKTQGQVTTPTDRLIKQNKAENVTTVAIMKHLQPDVRCEDLTPPLTTRCRLGEGEFLCMTGLAHDSHELCMREQNSVIQYGPT